jgi:5-methylcytosine-specific restriction enzyme A
MATIHKVIPKYAPVPEQTIRRISSDAAFYNSPAWRSVRRSHISGEPYCVACAAEGTFTDCTFGGVVDHVVRIQAGGAPLDPRNFMTLCPPHHDAKSRMERHGLTVDAEGPDGGKYPTKEGKKATIEKLKEI